MKWFLETTQWADAGTPNGIYLLDDSKSKMYAYRPHARAPIKTFKAPIRIDVRGRKFRINDVQFDVGVEEEQPEGRVWTVKGSKGDEYQVSESNGEYSCTCSGFKFRAKCRHVDEVAANVAV
jgi:hypothetical protein